MERRYIETLAQFNDTPESEYEGKDYWDKYVFDINEVIEWNCSDDGHTTTITLSTSKRWTIGIKYDDFKALIGKSITTHIDSAVKYEYEDSLVSTVCNK